MKKIIDEMFRRPFEAMTACARILNVSTPPLITIDALISRATHTLSRARTSQDAKRGEQRAVRKRR